MNARMRLADDLDGIVGGFAQMVKGLARDLGQVADERDVHRLEDRIRAEGQAILGSLMQTLLQQAIDERQEQARACPACAHRRRRHQGVRSRRLRSTLGMLELRGIYWKCPRCRACSHSVESLMPESCSRRLRELVYLAGASVSGFGKAQRLLEMTLGVSIDQETIRRACHREGWALLREPPHEAVPTPVAAKDDLIGSCDGTMVHTREGGWREVKAYRFEHSGGVHAGAMLEKVEHFAPRLKAAAQRIGALRADRTGRDVFISDMALWIAHAVRDQLPGWKHIADYWHVCQHVHAAGEAIYGPQTRRARRWSTYWSRRLKRDGGAALVEKMRRIALHYRDLSHQSAVLRVMGLLEKHADQTQYAEYQRQGLPIGSGPMESMCKQLGLRMKGQGMHWATRNVTSMAMLVTRWSINRDHTQATSRTLHAAA
jgi:hypothetical protein